MQFRFLWLILFLTAVTACCSCNPGGNKSAQPKVYKGLYSFGPEVKSFKDCETGHEYWVTDKSNKLELEYANMNFEKPYEPVYVEVQGEKAPSGKEGIGSEYDSTLVVRRLIKITKEIPQECN
jgi:copper homeostasis protein (lipoprotein)